MFLHFSMVLPRYLWGKKGMVITQTQSVPEKMAEGCTGLQNTIHESGQTIRVQMPRVACQFMCSV